MLEVFALVSFVGCLRETDEEACSEQSLSGKVSPGISGLLLHQCSDCGKSFSQNCNLKSHQRTLTGKRAVSRNVTV
ncbi:hypothetical protein MDA_GLEAN10000299 [Myotis davidii]|uniref:C2H2-type domain-containing protein n=1 Tax=Myotis davidii TaxID=225400 RepID=L5LR53_MYODS|nr:hypothetical protein MDA_GLEAN10000299 [Myotis davidii]